MAIPITQSGVMYIDNQELAQLRHDHRYDTYHWFIEQFQQDPTELQELNVNVDPPNFGPPEEEFMVKEDSEEEEDLEEEENFERFDSSTGFESSEDSEELDYFQDSEDFEP